MAIVPARCIRRNVPQVTCTNAAGDQAVTYSTGGHTDELVTLSAIGMDVESTDLVSAYEGAFYPGTHIVDNAALLLDHAARRRF